MKKHPCRKSSRVERLETRRHLSGEVELRWEPAVGDSAAFDGTELRANALARLKQGPAEVFTPEPMTVRALSVVGGTAATGRQVTGALSGKTVFTVGGHGFVAFDNGTTQGWHTQRGESTGTEMVEDLGTQDQMTFYVNHLFNAGATVVPLRPVGYQPNEVVIDNDDPQVTYTGTWSNSTSTIFFGSAGDTPYRYSSVSAAQTATAKYTPNIPAAGFYPVYTWVKDDTDRINQLYRVAHTGGITEVRVDHSKVGKGYVYLGTYYFNAGAGGYVEISNQGTNTGSSVVIADSIRFGNGMGTINRGWGVSGQTRSDESALYWIEYQRGQGVSDSQFRGTIDSDDTDNVGAPPRWAAWMNREVAGTNNEIFLSFHSNGGTGTSRGTLGLYNGNNDPATKTPFQFEWASLVGEETNDDMVALSGSLEYAWQNDNTPTLDRSDIEFGEINNLVIGDEFDATILEVAYHDNVMDAALMRDPKVRDYVGRASLQATIKYFRTYNSEPALALPPDAVTNVRAVAQANGDVAISWAAPVVDAIGGEAATGYAILTSTNGYGFGNPIPVAGAGTLSYTIPAAQLNGATYFRVHATNAGGESMASEVVAARPASGPKVLIVNGFDRISRQQNPTQTTSLSYTPPSNPGSNTFERVRPRFSNSYDYAIQAAEAIKNYSGTFVIDTASNEALIAGQVSLSNYAAVIWLAGEESTADDTFNATEQSLVTTYLNAGGKLFVSGAEIGWDLDSQGGGASFYNNQLKADYVADDAGTYSASGVAGSIFAGISLSFDNGASGTYNVDTPDTLAAFGGSTLSLVYTGGAGAGVQYVNPNTGRLVHLAFPFETITTAANRNAVMSAVLNFFALTSAGGDISGKVFRDVDGDGAIDAGETGLNSWTVFLDTDNDGNLDGGETTDTTAGDGDYSFDDLPVGSYNVRVVQNSIYSRTTPASGVYVVNVTAGSATANQNFGQFPNTYTGGSGADVWTLRANAGDTSKVDIVETLSGQGPVTFTIAKSLLAMLTFNGSGGDDRLNVEHSTANPMPSGGVSYTGGTHAGNGDTVVLTTTSSNDTVSITDDSVSFGGTITLSGVERATVNGGNGDDTLNLSNATPAVTFNGNASTTQDTLNLNAGSQTFTTDQGAATTNLNLVIGSAASATFNATQHFASLSVLGSATLAAGGDKVIVARALASGGRLDLNDNALIREYSGGSPIGSWNGSSYTGVTGLVAAGRNGGTWDSLTGITTSQSNATDGSGYTTLAIAEASEALGISGSQTALFADETVDVTAVLIRYTYGGDANLSGNVDVDDYGQIDFNASLGGTLAGFFNGDFDYTGVQDVDDYGVIDFVVGIQGPPL